MTRARGLAGFASAISGPVNSTDVFVGVLTATSMTINGTASIGGTITYEDVTNVDSVGIVTAQSGIHVTGGSVGIGTNNPNAIFHVEKDGTSQVLARFESNMGTNNNRSIALSSPTSDSGSEPFIFNTGNAYQFQTDDQVALHINYNRDIGIGTDDPGASLHIETSDASTVLQLERTDAPAKIVSSFGGGDSAFKYTVNNASSFKLGIDDSDTDRFKLSFGSSDNADFGTNDFFTVSTAGDVGIGTNTQQQKLCVAGPGASAIIDLKRTNTNGTGAIGAINFIANTDNSVASIFASADGDDSGAHIRFKTTSAAGENDPYGSSTTEGLRITSSQSVFMGNYFESVNNLRDAQTTTNRAAKVQIVGNNGPGAGLALVSYHDGDSGYYSPHLWLAKSDTSTTGSNNLVGDGEDLGSICFAGNDGTRFLNAAAIITEVDGTSGTNDMPGRLEFHVCANGASSLTERFRIQNNGNLLASDTTIGSLSDSRLKTNISDFTYDLELFKQFQPRTFDWINPELHDNAVGQRGFIAQEIESVDATYVFESKIKESSDDSQLIGDDNVAKSAKFGKNDAMYISVIQQLISKIETLETKVATLEGN